MKIMKKVSEKTFIDVMLWKDGMWRKYITSVQAQYVKGKDGWSFDQFEGHIYSIKKGAGKVPTGSKWFWGIDSRKASRNYGHLYRDLTLKDDPYKVVLMARNGVPFDPWSIARAVYEHFAPAAPAQQTKAPDITPLERLQAGDVSVFLELGISQVRASKWAQQIREGVKIKKIEDVSVIKGVGPHMAEKIVKVWNEKFST